MRKPKTSTVFFVVLVLYAFLLTGCNKEDQPKYAYEYTYDFSDGLQGWTGFFSDYPGDDEDQYELTFDHVNLPAPLNTNEKAVIISGNNHSDDLLSCMVKWVNHIVPNTTFEVTFDIDLASCVATNSAGIGGSPDLAFGVGALDFEPADSLDEANWYRPNFVSRLQSHQSNDTLQMIGTIGVSDTTTVFTLINRNNRNNPFEVTSNNDGEIWLLIGTDSGFEGTTTLYIKSVDIRLESLE